MNRADPTLLEYMKYHIDNVDPSKGPTYEKAKRFGQILIDNCEEVVNANPVYRDVALPTAPHTEVTAKGDIIYTEIVRKNVRKLENYVKEMASGGEVEPSVNLEKVQSDIGASAALFVPFSHFAVLMSRKTLGSCQLPTLHHPCAESCDQVNVLGSCQVPRPLPPRFSRAGDRESGPRPYTWSQAAPKLLPIPPTQRSGPYRGR